MIGEETIARERYSAAATTTQLDRPTLPIRNKCSYVDIFINTLQAWSDPEGSRKFPGFHDNGTGWW